MRDHGEVFTAEREVKAMCDLVKDETERIDSRFLEPACGNGNFLAEILTRKLATVKKLYKSNPYDYERYAVLAATSIYGVEILADNAAESETFLRKFLRANLPPSKNFINQTRTITNGMPCWLPQAFTGWRY